MEIQLIQAEELNEDDEMVTVWRLNKGNDTIIINVNKLFDAPISECDWLDKKKKFLQVMYIEWESSELFAIVNTNGEIIRKGIKSIENTIENKQLFIVMMSGFGMKDEAIDYFLDEDDWKMGVINHHGNFILPPKYSFISFDDEDNIFYAKNYTTKELMFDLNGKEIL